MNVVEENLESLIQLNSGLLVSLGVSHPSLDSILQTTQSLGFISKLTGAGGGGCMLTLLSQKLITSEDKLLRLKKALSNQGFTCMETDLGGSGVELCTRLEEGSLPLNGKILSLTGCPIQSWNFKPLIDCWNDILECNI